MKGEMKVLLWDKGLRYLRVSKILVYLLLFYLKKVRGNKKVLESWKNRRLTE